MNQKIGILDSGIGGTTILKELLKLLPQEDYIYYADSKNNPYGEKKQEELEKIVDNIVNYLVKEKTCKMIVIACNTATTRCMKKLKEKYKETILIGTVPAIKVACDKNYKHTLVLATPATIISERTEELIQENKNQNQEIRLMACEGLAHAIEENKKKEIKEILKTIKHKTIDFETDSIVLGCTHYPLIKQEINNFFPKIPLLDGSFGVAKEVKRQLENHNLLNTKGTGNVEWINSRKN